LAKFLKDGQIRAFKCECGVYTPYEGDVTCSRCGASYRQNLKIKMASPCFW